MTLFNVSINVHMFYNQKCISFYLFCLFFLFVFFLHPPPKFPFDCTTVQFSHLSEFYNPLPW